MARSSECTGSYAHKVLDRDLHCQRRLISSTIVTLIDRGSECKSLWVLKNSLFVPNSQNWGDRKCLGDPRKSIVGHPDAILFLPISRQGVFQQPRLVTPVWVAVLTQQRKNGNYADLSLGRTAMRIRRDSVFISAVLFTIALLCALPMSLRNASEGYSSTTSEVHDLCCGLYLHTMGDLGVASLAIIFIALIVTWAGYAKFLRSACFAMCCVVSVW